MCFIFHYNAQEAKAPEAGDGVVLCLPEDHYCVSLLYGRVLWHALSTSASRSLFCLQHPYIHSYAQPIFFFVLTSRLRIANITHACSTYIIHCWSRVCSITAYIHISPAITYDHCKTIESLPPALVIYMRHWPNTAVCICQTCISELSINLYVHTAVY